VNAASSFFAEFLATAILAMMILAMTDKRNLSPAPGLLPVAIFLMIMGIGTSLGMQTGEHHFPRPFKKSYLVPLKPTLSILLETSALASSWLWLVMEKLFSHSKGVCGLLWPELPLADLYPSHYWLWCPILGPICGAQAGALVYDFFLNDDSTLLDRDAE
jgi:aquaglyceroporin related protein, other eukaryote